MSGHRRTARRVEKNPTLFAVGEDVSQCSVFAQLGVILVVHRRRMYLFRPDPWSLREADGTYGPARLVITVGGYLTNNDGEVLLVRTHVRSDTWELPGGQVKEGETLHEALRREVLAETGIEAIATGVTGVYQDVVHGVVTLVFRGRTTGGQPRPSPGTQEVAFHRLDAANVSRLVTRPHLRSRVLDAMRGDTVTYEAARLRYQVGRHWGGAS